MFTTKRRFEPSVIQRLLDEPYRFQFFQAVRIVELWLKQHGVPHENAVTDFVRFKNRTSLSFPASELDALKLSPSTIKKTDAELSAALEAGELAHIALTPSFMGFLGGNGTLPAHYTERIAEHVLFEKDDSPREFLDTFSNRAVALFYEAWRKYRLEFKYELGKQGQKDQFLPLLLSLAGLGHDSLQKRLNPDGDGLLDQSMGYYASASMQRPISAAHMQRLLSEYFLVDIKVEQFIGCWYGVPEQQQTMLGLTNATLGSESMVGARVWQRDLRMRLMIGPLSSAKFESFLPGGKSAKTLEQMLGIFSNLCLEFEVQLVLRKEDVQAASLISERMGGRLGWNSFLMTAPPVEDRKDVQYEIHAL
ncbi:MAG: type VI secretion system baseplate subunit TssG [Undibacterium sp.]|uniref:type VI secretion system baseplate subunit TssG n=1 Tax=Undibacterium sp. TaxID=1914977 RepID=UPI00271638D6|nr:type VI secretion system baseplate subunit TssG [Undibacterium sp.]MDO8652947.1 type VI secretion system baseplate subunit TssG [Undibacterium sp.]